MPTPDTVLYAFFSKVAAITYLVILFCLIGYLIYEMHMFRKEKKKDETSGNSD